MNNVRSARGVFVDFDLLAIKASLASTPTPAKVVDRKLAIEEREGIKPLSAQVQTVAPTKTAPKSK